MRPSKGEGATESIRWLLLAEARATHSGWHGREPGGFTNLNCTTPCCGTRTTLNDLAYITPVGFARFVMDAPDPGRPDLEPEEMAELEELLGCRLRLVWGHI